ncbi:hypothetical protein N7519_007951 [Penicillium mononematosum]|uniref:uncharacterized protein n=1 Tax=Penicillium mononematosum TaxID=268346 RepID=UPI002547F3D5|nr:uncharacterized protein N7519_007951 [Penicillium mononematosum]KAJ6186650.1 hypothetical protein N7519_007951 [Penicillium mononematosum]
MIPSTKAAKCSFERMFDPNPRIDFAENLPDTTNFLSTPEPTDKLVQAYRKLAKLADLVKEGKSLAIHTNYAKALHKQRNPITEAKDNMLPSKLSQYNAWVGGAVMPTIDWKNSRTTVELPQHEDSRLTKQVRAIREIYDNPHISRTNAYWFMSNFRYILPLIEAVVIVGSAQRKYVRDREGLTETELAELETARNIVQVTMDILEKRERRLELDDTLRMSTRTVGAGCAAHMSANCVSNCLPYGSVALYCALRDMDHKQSMST